MNATLRTLLFVAAGAACALAPSLARAAGAPISYDAAMRAWAIQTVASTYVLGVNDDGYVQQIYWGPRLADPFSVGSAKASGSDASFGSPSWEENLEYPGWGVGMSYSIPALKLSSADGDRAADLHYASYRIDGDTLDVTLRDAVRPMTVVLTYRAYPQLGIVAKSARIENDSSQSVMIESAQSGIWFTPRGQDYRLTYLSGAYGSEFHVTQVPIEQGTFEIQSRTGTTSHEFNPWFALDGGGATEENGNVWFGALAWSGTWKISVERTYADQVRVVGGISDFDFGVPLAPGTSFETPVFYGGFTSGGFGATSRMLHRFELAEILPASTRARVRPVVYDSWEATGFDVTQAGQEALADQAAKAGVELFLVDDGWFGARNNDHAGLGDWYPNPQKFPQGLKPLIDYVHHLGMRFGIWMEPEMVNPDSNLFRAHPDWIIGFPNRPHTMGRNQYVLNLARPDVAEWLFQTVDRVVTQNHITFIKWDMNRSISEPGWPQVPVAQQREIWVDYVRNLYAVMDRLRAKHPDLEIQTCSGGGGRVDLGILQRTDEAWTSDDTDPYDRLFIQNGFSYAYAPKVMVDWVTDHPEPLEYSFLVAMQGTLGMGGDLSQWTPEQMATAARMVAYYKTIRSTVQLGDLYRLIDPQSGPFAASEYVSRDGAQSVLFVYAHGHAGQAQSLNVRLRALDPNATYRVHAIDGALQGNAATLSGAQLMSNGLRFALTGEYAASSVTLDREP